MPRYLAVVLLRTAAVCLPLPPLGTPALPPRGMAMTNSPRRPHGLEPAQVDLQQLLVQEHRNTLAAR